MGLGAACARRWGGTWLSREVGSIGGLRALFPVRKSAGRCLTLYGLMLDCGVGSEHLTVWPDPPLDNMASE